MADDFKYRIDHHGSLIRPSGLMEARRRWQAGAIDEEELRRVEEEAIAEAVRLQRKLRFTVVTDGEFPREDTRSVVFDAVSGFRPTDELDAYGRVRWIADGELKAERPLVADRIAFLKEQTVIAPKVSLPSPAWLAAQCFEPSGPWRSARELGEELARIIGEEIGRLVEAGVRLIQINNFAYARHLVPGRTPLLPLEDCIAIDTAAVSGVSRPEDVRIGLCPTHSAKGEVDTAAAARVFEEVPVDRWVLPYCGGTEGELALLRAVPADRDACLGVVDPRTPELEDIDTVVARMDAAAEVKDIDDMAVSPSEGFSDVAGRAVLNEDEQRRKLVHVETVARMCWGNEL
ncbi:methionine synthase II (cobalamin-independent)-like protein [Thermobifida halotolerans]|uniref:Methionine synthase II (Cobalamin-independent)-like protein n=1 Tax=Thermobifida halotolerans TaxID=483545 RepID=A0A399G4G3_9ACTN|nr:methionine synthase II (cobalamin-independent)-like protein [Thermobifida halotolerans]UOE20933.1 methionine synthase II (cobalamin-independent)-like protein [Thermobifida halotolerans]